MVNPNELGQKLIAVLAPSVGDFMAKAKVTAACHLCGTEIDAVDRAHRAPVADRLEALCNSLGPNVAKSIKERAAAI